jgi:hypothetical protein
MRLRFGSERESAYLRVFDTEAGNTPRTQASDEHCHACRSADSNHHGLARLNSCSVGVCRHDSQWLSATSSDDSALLS